MRTLATAPYFCFYFCLLLLRTVDKSVVERLLPGFYKLFLQQHIELQ